MTDTMRAGCASPDGLVSLRVPVPQAGGGQILVKVHAAGMNRADLVAAKGAYTPAKDTTSAPIGMEWAGEVVAVGDGVSEFRVGDLVCCSGSGGYAEFAVADTGRAIKIDPSRLSVEQASVLPLALMTAHNALVSVGGMRIGDAVLVHGASSAVGLAALRIASLLGARFVGGTSTDPAKRERLAEFGATATFDPSQANWSKAVKEATGGKGADVIVDMVTGPGLIETMKAAAVLGRIVNVGRLGGTRTEFDLDIHALNRLSVVGVTFRTRSLDEIREIVRLMKDDVWAFVESGQLALPIDRTFPLSEASQALDFMAANRHFGKLLLIP